VLFLQNSASVDIVDRASKDEQESDVSVIKFVCIKILLQRQIQNYVVSLKIIFKNLCKLFIAPNT